jgi:hypothetical protein
LADRSLGGRGTGKHIQTAGPGLEKWLQRGAFGSIRIGPQPVKGSADKAEMN